jgi:hypothetical protein
MVVDIQTSSISVIASGMTNTIFAMSNRHSTMTGIYSRPNVVRTGRSGDDFAFLKQEICQSKRKISHRVSDESHPAHFEQHGAALPQVILGRRYTQAVDLLWVLYDLQLQANRWESQEDFYTRENNEVYFFWRRGLQGTLAEAKQRDITRT